MATDNLKVGATLCLVASMAALLGTGAARADTTAIEPEAKQILKRMTDYLAGLESFSLSTDNMIEEVLDTGQKLQYDFAADIKIQRPDRLRADRSGDMLEQHFIYNGESLMIYNPRDGVFAQTAAPDNLDDLLHFARDTLDIVPPTGDMVFTNAYELLMAPVTSGGVVGKSMVGGVRCDHLAFRTPLVDWQIWIADGDEPLPYKYVLTTMDDPALPQYLVLMSDWNVDPKFDETLFEISRPKGAQEIDFLRVEADPSSAR